MRNTALALILFLAATASLAAGESMRLNFVKGLYSVNVPANWYIDVDTGDSTLSIAQGPDAASPRVIIAIPNPRTNGSLGDYAVMAANSFMNAFSGGTIMENKDNKDGHGVIFRANASGVPFVGAVQTLRHNNYAILTVFLTRQSDYERTKEWAGIVLDSLRINDNALERQTAFVSAQADNLLKDLQRYQGGVSQRAPSTTTGTTTTTVPTAPTHDSGSLWGNILGGSLGGNASGSPQDQDVAGSLGSLLNSILGGDEQDSGIARQNQGRAPQSGNPAPRGSVPDADTSGYGNLLNNPFSGLTR